MIVVSEIGVLLKRSRAMFSLREETIKIFLWWISESNLYGLVAILWKGVYTGYRCEKGAHLSHGDSLLEESWDRT